MRISDWSSDVCSSDLVPKAVLTTPVATAPFLQAVVLSSSVPVLAPPVSWVPSSLCSTTQVMPATAGRLAPAPQASSSDRARGRIRGKRGLCLAMLLGRSEEHTAGIQSLLSNSYAVF